MARHLTGTVLISMSIYADHQSRGTVRLQSADPLDRPLIDPRYLSEPIDLDLALKGLKKVLEIGNARAFSEVGAKQTHPGPEMDSDQDLVQYIRRVGTTIWHPVGTCKMGHDTMAVVDDELRVRGLSGLRVADASIMPTIVSGNTNAPCIMIGEKASDLVLAPTRIGASAMEASSCSISSRHSHELSYPRFANSTGSEVRYGWSNTETLLRILLGRCRFIHF